jgi:phage gp46-like protein
MAQCSTETIGRRRLFWSTQPCGSSLDDCGNPCPEYGLVYIDTPQGRTIANDNWVVGLAVNILMTNARKQGCANNLSDLGGHWSESFNDGSGFGSNFRNIPRKKTVAEYIGAIQAAIQTDLSVMIRYGVASSIDVFVKYLGNNTFSAAIDINGLGSEKNGFAIAGQQSVDGFLWGMA